MNAKFLVVGETPSEWVSKTTREVHKVVRLLLVDRCASGNRLAQMVEYEFSEQEKLEHAGKLMDKEVTIGITGIAMFGAVTRVRGKIIGGKYRLTIPEFAETALRLFQLTRPQRPSPRFASATESARMRAF